MWLTYDMFIVATWTNTDGSKATPTLIYDVGSNVLSFTANPLGLYNLKKEVPVVRVPSSLPLVSAIFDLSRLTTAFTDHFPRKIDTSPLRLLKLAGLIFEWTIFSVDTSPFLRVAFRAKLDYFYHADRDRLHTFPLLHVPTV